MFKGKHAGLNEKYSWMVKNSNCKQLKIIEGWFHMQGKSQILPICQDNYVVLHRGHFDHFDL